MAEEIQVPSLPNIKIVDHHGKSLDTSAIDNYDAFMSYLIQAASAAHLARIRKIFEDTVPVGEVQNWELAITPEVQEIICAHPSQSIYMINDGPGDIFVTINSLGRTPTHLYAHDEMIDEFKAHKLYRFYVRSALDTVAAARARVQY